MPERVNMSSDTRLLSNSRPSTQVGRKAQSSDSLQQHRDFFQKEPCLYSHQIFRHAARVFDALKHERQDERFVRPRGKTSRRHVRDDRLTVPSGSSQGLGLSQEPGEVPSIDFDSENDKRLTFQLVFRTLKYQRFLEDMLDDCSFFSQYPEFKDDMSVVMVILCDFTQRKFQKRVAASGEELIEYHSQIEQALYQSRTKLNAALARSRIKARVLSIDHLLPATVRQNEKIGSNMHLYGWVNLIKTSMESVLEELREGGYVEVQSEGRLSGQTFMLDGQCYDTICFPHDCRDLVEHHSLVQDRHIVLQDKSSCVGPHSIRALINEGDDVLHVHVGSGLTTAHIASLTHNSDTVIYATGFQSEKQQRQVTANLELLGAKSRVKILPENFVDIDHADERLKHIKVVLLTAECSRSAVANPVSFIVSEGEDMSILRDLSLGQTDENRLSDFVVKHNTTLKHALRFPRVQAVVYCTRSLLEAENEHVVTRSIEYVNMVQQKKTPYRISPPVIPLSDRDIEMENPLNGKYLRYPPSAFMSGCFVATITREADDPKEAAKDILAKAAARGILGGVSAQGGDKPAKSKAKSGRRRDKGRRKSPSRTKSLVQKETAFGSTVSRMKASSAGALVRESLTHSSTEPCGGSPTHHQQVFPGGDKFTASQNGGYSKPKEKTPPHAKIIRHPMPFR